MFYKMQPSGNRNSLMFYGLQPSLPGRSFFHKIFKLRSKSIFIRFFLKSPYSVIQFLFHVFFYATQTSFDNLIQLHIFNMLHFTPLICSFTSQNMVDSPFHLSIFIWFFPKDPFCANDNFICWSWNQFPSLIFLNLIQFLIHSFYLMLILTFRMKIFWFNHG